MPRQHYAVLNFFAESPQLEIETELQKRKENILLTAPLLLPPHQRIRDFGYNDRYM